jgi:hypothetical protein
LALGFSVVGAGLCGLVGTLISERMVTDVNARLPAPEQFPRTGWEYFKSQRLWEAYCRLYPHGPLIVRSRVVSLIFVAIVPSLIWSAGFGLAISAVAFLVAAGGIWRLFWR